jgi:heme A synthase
VQALRAIYKYWAALVLLAVVAQIAAAAYGGFYSADKLGDQSGRPDELRLINEKTFDNGFDFHSGFGYLIFLASVVLFLLALGARVGRPRIWWNLALPLLLIVQILLATGGEDVPFIGAFHGVNALVIFGLSGSLTGVAWRRKPAPATPV